MFSFGTGLSRRADPLVQPEPQVRRVQHLLHHVEQVGTEHIEIDLLAELDGELCHHAIDVIPSPVEPPVDCGLHPSAQALPPRPSRRYPDTVPGSLRELWLRLAIQRLARRRNPRWIQPPGTDISGSDLHNLAGRPLFSTAAKAVLRAIASWDDPRSRR